MRIVESCEAGVRPRRSLDQIARGRLVPWFGSRPDFATYRAAVVVNAGDLADAIEESRVVIAVLAALHIAPLC